MRANANDQRILDEMYRKFSELAILQSELSQNVQQTMLELHGEHFTVNHCVRWGEIAISEVTSEIE